MLQVTVSNVGNVFFTFFVYFNAYFTLRFIQCIVIDKEIKQQLPTLD